jgi:hypothetical protein
MKVGITLLVIGILWLLTNLTFRIIWGMINLNDFTFWTQIIIPSLLIFFGIRRIKNNRIKESL